MSTLKKYPVFEWTLNDSRDAIEARAELSGGTLVEVYLASAIDPLLASHGKLVEALKAMVLAAKVERLHPSWAILIKAGEAALAQEVEP